MRKIDKKLLDFVTINSSEKYVEVVVFLDGKSSLEKLKKDDVEIVREYNFINAVGIRVNNSNLLNLSNRDYIKYISSIQTVKTQIYDSKKLMNLECFYKENIYGQGVNVCVIDTGTSPMPDFVMPKNRIIKFVDFVNQKDESYDDNGHGTFVSGVLLGNGLISNGKYSGVASECNLISLKALDKSGEATTFKVLDALQWIYKNKEKYKIKILCLSFGSEPIEYNDPLSYAVDVLWKIGVVVVVAGGNSGPSSSSIKSPGISSRVITVGGLNDYKESKKYTVADFSSRGPVGIFPKPDIIAPAVDVVSNSNELIEGKGYLSMSGTSVATPMIAGVCALLICKYPNIKPDQVKSYILNNGFDLGLSRNEQGKGLFIAK